MSGFRILLKSSEVKVKYCWLQEFNYGVEFLLLIGFDESASEETVKDALASLDKLTKDFPSLIVQSTQGILEIRSE